MADQAVPRPENQYPWLPEAARYTHQLELDPNFQPPKGFHIEPTPAGIVVNGRRATSGKPIVVPDAGFVDKHGLQLLLTGAAILTGGAAIAGAGPFAAGTAAVPSLGTTSGITGTTLPGSVVPIGSGLTGAGTAAVGGVGGATVAGAAGSAPSLVTTSGLTSMPGTTVPIGGPAGGSSAAVSAAGGVKPPVVKPPSKGFGMNANTALGLAEVGSGIFNSISNAQANRKNAALTKQQIETQAVTNALQGNNPAGLNAAFDRNTANTLRQLMQHMKTPGVSAPAKFASRTGHVQSMFNIPEGGFDTSFLDPSALQAQEQNYQDNLQTLNPNYKPLDLSQVGYSGVSPQQQALDDALRRKRTPSELDPLGVRGVS